MKEMYRTFSQGLVILALVALGQVQQSEAGKGKPGGGGGTKAVNVPVMITFEPSGGGGIRSDAELGGQGRDVYTDGDPGVTAYIDASNGWVRMFTCASANPKSPCLSTGERYQVFEYTKPSSEFNLGEVHVAAGNFNIHPRDEYGNNLPGGFRDIMNDPGDSRVAGMLVNYSDIRGDGSFLNYTTRFAPLMYPESNYVLVTFLGGSLDCSSGTCASWSVQALSTELNDPSYPVFGLEDIATLANRDNSATFGNYHMPFRLIVTVLPPQ